MTRVNATAATGQHLLEKLLLGLAVTVVATSTLVWGTGWVAAAIVGAVRPSWSLFEVPHAVTGYPGVPLALSSGLLAALVAAASVAGFVAWRAIARRRAGVDARKDRFEARSGWASRHEVQAASSKSRLLGQARELRPTLDGATAADLGFRLGTSRGVDVWASIERSFLIVGPPGSGKGLFFAVNMLLDAVGPVVTTSTKPDNLKMTLQHRAEQGPVGVFDPQGILGPTFPHLVSWDIVAGCQDPSVAGTRAAALANQSGISDTSENAMWRGFAKTVIECCLHAAAVRREATGALDGTTIRDVFGWIQGSGEGLDTPTQILRAHADHAGCRNPVEPDVPVACRWAARLESVFKQEQRFVSSVMSVVQGSLASLGYPTVMASLTPHPARPAFDAATLLDAGGTIYCLATDKGSVPAAGFVAALIEDIAYAARVRAARSGGRLEPNLTFVLDECANVCATLPSLPTLLADGRGQNLTVVPIFQTLAQVRSRYGKDDADTIFSASTVKIILGGNDNPADNKDMSELIGTVDEVVMSSSQSASAVLIDTKASTSTSLRKEPILPPDQIRSIPFGTGVVLLSQTAPFPLRMQAWTDRPDADTIRAATAQVGAQIRAAGGNEVGQ